MDNEIIKDIYQKINELNSELSEIKIILARQEISLSEHIRRTEIAEKSIEKNEKALNKAIELNTSALKEIQREFKDEMAPVKQEVAKLEGMIKLIGIVIALGSLGIQILNFIFARIG